MEIGQTKAAQQLGEQLKTRIADNQQHLALLDAEIAGAQRQANEVVVTRLQERRVGVEGDIRQLQKRRGGMSAKIGARMEKKVEEVRSRRRDAVNTGVAVFAAVVSITLSIVQFVAGG